MRLLWTPEALEDYRYWEKNDQKVFEAINALIADIRQRNPFTGLGKPEPVKYALAGWWSRRSTLSPRPGARVRIESKLPDVF
jgi:toxin YoeB